MLQIYSTHKIDKFTPLSRIPISSDQEVFFKIRKNICIDFIVEYIRNIKRKLLKINPNIEFVNF